ncbi:hypothetical protein [Streptomyces sp. 6N223]|uniref:hypothetical protein n=1 Tax=Streptomyces sp. 6N223 TaxID=3457412 RepID=UPI003FD4B0B7
MDTTTHATSGSAAQALGDTIIIGGGAPGLSAGVVPARAQFATLVVDGGEPGNGPADHMRGYLTRDGMAPREFVARGREEVTRYGGTLLPGSVVDARRAPDGTFDLRLDDGETFACGAIFVAPRPVPHAGNVVNPRAQVAAAAGAGSTTALSMAAWLLDGELSAAVSGERPGVGGAR